MSNEATPEWIALPMPVTVRDGDKPGVYEMTVWHEATCPRVTVEDGDCNCDAQISKLVFLHGLEGPN